MIKQITSLECNKKYTISFKGKDFVIEKGKDIIRLLRLQEKIKKLRFALDK